MSIPTPASTTPRTASRVTRTSAISSHHPSSPSSADSPEPSTSGARRDASLACAACGEANGPERNFCAACGEPLREACPRCGAAHARSERFCGQCGLNVGDHYAEQQQYCRERLEAARQLKAEYRFDDALQRLKEVLKVTDAKPGETKLAEFLREANDELRHLHAERLRREQEANQTLEIARQAIANHAIERAITLLDDVPQPLRTAAHQETLADAKARWKEILGLSGQIRSLLAEKKTLELSGPIERLLALKPDHREARQLADQLAAKLVDAARKKILQREFDDALALLRRIPAVARPAVADEIENEANEAVWLMKHLRRAAYVTPVLAQVAERAARTAPDHPDLARVTNELIQRQRAKPRTPWLAAPEWSVPPQTPAAGAVAHWIGGFSRVTVAAGETAGVVARNPGRWFVACGLALQGLGRAAVDVNILPQEKGSLWSRLPFGGRRKASDAAWGIDLGQSALKAVRMTWDEKQQVASIVEAAILELPESAERDSDSVGELRQAVIRQFLGDRSLEGHRVCVNLPGLLSLGRWFTVPPGDAKKTTAAIEFEAKRQVAFPLNELTWDYALLDGSTGAAANAGSNSSGNDGSTGRPVAMLAAKTHVVQSLLKSWTSAGVNPDVMQSDCVALHNWLRFDQPEHADATRCEGVTAILDVGSDATNILFSGPTMLSFRTVGVGGDSVTKALTRELKLARPEAEQLKVEPHKSPRLAPVAAAVAPVHEQLLREYHRSLSQLASLSPETQVGRLLCVGGAAGVWGLIETLRDGDSFAASR